MMQYTKENMTTTTTLTVSAIAATIVFAPFGTKGERNPTKSLRGVSFDSACC